jgi:hypothetical protein
MNIAVDLKNLLATPTQVQPPAAKTATFNSANSLDLKEYIGNVLITQDIGTTTGTTPTLDGKIQDSADNSSFADVSGYAFTQATAAGIANLNVDTRKVRRYIRYVGTIGGTTPSFTMSVTAYGQKQVVGTTV